MDIHKVLVDLKRMETALTNITYLILWMPQF